MASGTTDQQGGAAFTVRPSETTWYSIRHPETANAGATEAGGRIAVTDAKAPPSPPERVVAVAGDARAHVSWLPTPDDGGSAVTSYVVRAVASGHTVTSARHSSARTATLTGLRNGYAYRISVTATTARGSAARTRDGYVVPRAGIPAPPAGGTQVCGRLPLGVTRWTAAASPYVVCPAGLVVPVGATLEVDGAELRFRGVPSRVFGEPFGLEVRGGTLRVTRSVLRGERGVRGEWRGVLADAVAEDWSWPYGATGTAVSFSGSTVRHAVEPVRLVAPTAFAGFAGTLLADATGAGLRSGSALRASRLTVSDVGGNGVSVECGPTSYWWNTSYVECPVVLSELTVRRAGRRGLSVDTPDPVSIRGTVVTDSGRLSPRHEAVRIAGTTASIGPGDGTDIGDVVGGGNGIDAVVLDLTATNDLTWRTPVARSAAAPAPLGYMVRNLVMAPGRGITFPAGSVVKGLPAPYDCRQSSYEWQQCVGGIQIEGGVLEASAPGTVFTGAADPNAGITTCPSSLAPTCGAAGPWWSGLTSRSSSQVTLAGATVRGAAMGLYLSHYQLTGMAATVTATTFDRNGHALSTLGTQGGTLTLAGSTVTDSARSIDLSGLTDATVTGLTVRRSGGVTLTAGHARGGCGGWAPEFTVDGLVVEDAPGSGLTVNDLCHPAIRGVVVRRSGLPRGTDAIGKPAVAVNGIATYGPGKDVDVATGGGNGIDAIAISGWSEGDLLWRSPVNAAADHPLGYVLGGELAVTGAGTVTIPANALVAGFDGSALSVRGPALDASAGGARFVSVYDAPLGCRSGCGPRRWGIVQTRGPIDVPQGDAHVAGATVRGASLMLARDAYGTGEISVTGTTSDGHLFVEGARRATVTDSTFAGIEVGLSTEVAVERNTVPVANGMIRVSAATAPLVLKDNHVAAGTKEPAYLLGNVRATFGAGGGVSGNTGAGPNAVLALGGVAVEGDMDWVTPTADAAKHPVGYVVAAHQTTYTPARGLTVKAPYTLRVPVGGIVKADQITVEGALDATADGAVFTPISDNTVGVPTCHWTQVYSSGCRDPRTSPGGMWLRGGALGIRGARLNAWVDAGTVDAVAVTRTAPGETAFGVAIRDSSVNGSLRTYFTPVTVTGTTFVRGGVSMQYGSGHVVRDVRISGAPGPGLRLVNAPADVREVEVTGSGHAPESYDRGAVMVGGDSAGSTFACLDLRGNAAGFAAFDTPVTVTDSTLDDNAPGYDLHNVVAVTTTGVWWGQPLGPLPGQVRDPAKHTDTAPAAAAPACARAETP